ncbi:MAG: signal recognition particle-docking protein FtsY [Caldiserica bacterium]|jgi:fused signal recognition particle receptor|nr:signal recognition particle-docking protein FtsY [Caldisericota bacterium]MDH7562904.1 signal recognition particle-docking protein FtsY [Caldisericota bacterium]
MKWSDKVKGFFKQLTSSRSLLGPQELETLRVFMLEGDFGPFLVEEFLQVLKQGDSGSKGSPEPMELLENQLRKYLIINPGLKTSSTPPSVYLFVGVNGTGKTTSIAKVAHFLKKRGNSVYLACGDTFRAAAREQLKVWADRLGCPFVGYPTGGDPAAVAFDALEGAKAKGADFLLIDTAGRQHTDTNLMEELKKIKRIISKKKDGAPEETLLVLDSNAGLNSLNQARAFHKELGVTGIILAKFDSPAKAGFVFTIQKELAIPLKFLGLGEGLDDLIEFHPDFFLKKFLS